MGLNGFVCVCKPAGLMLPLQGTNKYVELNLTKSKGTFCHVLCGLAINVESKITFFRQIKRAVINYIYHRHVLNIYC